MAAIDPPEPTRRAVLAAVAGAGAAALAPGSAQAAAATTSFDPRGIAFRSRAFAYDLGIGSPYLTSYHKAYPLTLGLAADPRTRNGLVLDGSTVRVRVDGVYVPQMVSTSWYLLPQIASYRLDRSANRLRVIESTLSNALALSSTDAAGARWFHHTTPYHPATLGLSSPRWVSGMTQGMALSVLATLWETTRRESWRLAMEATARSYWHYRDESLTRLPGTWFVGYERGAGGLASTFFEEYPSTDGRKAAHVVNGLIYSTWGLFDYYRVTRNPVAKVLLDRAFESLLQAFPRYRAAGGPSWYAMTPFGYREWGRPTSYHYGVSKILRTTSRFTRNSVFSMQGLILSRDYAGR